MNGKRVVHPGNVFEPHSNQRLYINNHLHINSWLIVITKHKDQLYLNLVYEHNNSFYMVDIIGGLHNDCGPTFIHPECKDIWTHMGEICELKESIINNFLILLSRKIS